MAKSKRSRLVEEVEQFIPTSAFLALNKVDDRFDSFAFLNAVIQRWGGMDAFAADMHKTYIEAAEGSIVRQRIMQTITQQISKVTDRQSNTEADDIASLSNEDLEQIAASLLTRASAAMKPKGEVIVNEDEDADGSQEIL